MGTYAFVQWKCAFSSTPEGLKGTRNENIVHVKMFSDVYFHGTFRTGTVITNNCTGTSRYAACHLLCFTIQSKKNMLI